MDQSSKLEAKKLRADAIAMLELTIWEATEKLQYR